jgi:hypothetical protein
MGDELIEPLGPVRKVERKAAVRQQVIAAALERSKLVVVGKQMGEAVEGDANHAEALRKREGAHIAAEERDPRYTGGLAARDRDHPLGAVETDDLDAGTGDGEGHPSCATAELKHRLRRRPGQTDVQVGISGASGFEAIVALSVAVVPVKHTPSP